MSEFRDRNATRTRKRAQAALRELQLIAFTGAVYHEAQVGRLWVKVIRRRFLRTSWRRAILVGWERDDS